MKLVLKGVIIERLVSPYVNLLVVVRRKKVSKVICINAHSINQIIVNNGKSHKQKNDENDKQKIIVKM